MKWAQDTYSQDPEVPGSLPSRLKYNLSDMNAATRFVKWQYFEGNVSKSVPYTYSGVHMHTVCMF